VYRSITFRDEFVLDLMKPLTLEDALKAAGSEATLINFINGTELTREIMNEVCRQAKGFVQMDVHSKVARWNAEGKKSHVPFDDWREWTRDVDAMQMNEFEAGLTVGRELKTPDDFVAAGREIVAEGPPIVTITLGPQGSMLFHRWEGKAYHFACPAIEVEATDTTGCGDSYSAGFLWSYLQRKDPVAATCAANIVGGINCTTSGIGHLEAARGALEQIPRWYPDLADKVAAEWSGEPL
jgi:sugar/nucleoside kinase (ribokinase family)